MEERVCVKSAFVFFFFSQAAVVERSNAGFEFWLWLLLAYQSPLAYLSLTPSLN